MRQQGACYLLCGWEIHSHAVLSVAVAGALYALKCHLGTATQQTDTPLSKLSAEARAFYTGTPSMGELSGMTYCILTTRFWRLRFFTPVPSTVRVPTKDNVVLGRAFH